MPSPDDITRARAWLGRFFDHLPEKQRPARLPHDDERRTCVLALDALERELRRTVRHKKLAPNTNKQLTFLPTPNKG